MIYKSENFGKQYSIYYLWECKPSSKLSPQKSMYKQSNTLFLTNRTNFIRIGDKLKKFSIEIFIYGVLQNPYSFVKSEDFNLYIVENIEQRQNWKFAKSGRYNTQIKTKILIIVMLGHLEVNTEVLEISIKTLRFSQDKDTFIVVTTNQNNQQHTKQSYRARVS